MEAKPQIFDNQVVSDLIIKWIEANRAGDESTRDAILVEIWESTLGLRKMLIRKIGPIPEMEFGDWSAIMLLKLMRTLPKWTVAKAKIERDTGKSAPAFTILMLSWWRCILSQISKSNRSIEHLSYVESIEDLMRLEACNFDFNKHYYK